MKSIYAIPNLFIKSALLLNKLCFELIHYALFLINKDLCSIVPSDTDLSNEHYCVSIDVGHFNRMHPNRKSNSSIYNRIHDIAMNGEIETSKLIYLSPNKTLNTLNIIEHADYSPGLLKLVFTQELTGVFDYYSFLKNKNSIRKRQSQECPRLIQDCPGFTKIDITKLFGFGSVRGMKLYEILTSQKYDATNTTHIRIERLAFLMGLFDIDKLYSALNSNKTISLADIDFNDNLVNWRRLNSNIIKPSLKTANHLFSGEIEYSIKRVTKECLEILIEQGEIPVSKPQVANDILMPQSYYSATTSYKKNRKKVNSFHNFEERVYDFKELEKEMGIKT